MPAELSLLFRPSVQPYLISWFRYDPAHELAKLTIAGLIGQGTRDLQVDVAEAWLLGAARPDATVLIVDRMSHTLKLVPDEPGAEQAAYTDPTLPLAPQLVDGLTAFFDSVSSP